MKGQALSAVRVLGLCGILAATLTTVGGLCACPQVIGVGGLVMLLGNFYAVTR